MIFFASLSPEEKVELGLRALQLFRLVRRLSSLYSRFALARSLAGPLTFFLVVLISALASLVLPLAALARASPFWGAKHSAPASRSSSFAGGDDGRRQALALPLLCSAAPHSHEPSPDLPIAHG